MSAENNHVMSAKVHPPAPPEIEVMGTTGLPGAAFHMDMTIKQATELWMALGVAISEVGKWDTNVYD